MRQRIYVSLLATWLCASANLASAGPPDAALIQYWQRFQTMADVMGVIWKSFEKHPKDKKLAQYCATITRFNRRELARWTPPAKATLMQRSMVRMLELSEKVYHSAASGRWKEAYGLGPKIKSEFRTLQKRIRQAGE